MPRLALHLHRQPSARCSREFIVLRDHYRVGGMELYFDYDRGAYIVTRGHEVLTTLATMTAARRWLRRMS